MKIIHTTLIFVLCCDLLCAQSPIIKQWDKRYGGSGNDYTVSFERTLDGGYIAGMRSTSGSSGDKTEPSWGAEDYWIVKLDSAGNKQWDKRFGGDSYDWFSCVKQTPDGGYILGGSTRSHNNGDITQDYLVPPGINTFDYWVVKTDALGNKEWDRRFGGNNYDLFEDIDLTSDGGYILGGYTISDAGSQVSQPTRGSYDYWIVKIDSTGTKQWDKRFGGNSYDQLYSVKQTADGGYILGGMSTSYCSDDISQQFVPSGKNYWVVKTNANGIKEWDRIFGGTSDDWLFDIEQADDQGYLILGSSNSAVNSIKSQPNFDSTNVTSDCWLIKTDPSGNILWDKVYGGSDSEDEPDIIKTADGGYLVSCRSNSQASGNKSENNLASMAPWIIKLDANGNKQWDKTAFLENGYTTGAYAAQSGNCYAVATSTTAGIGGYKTQSTRGATDFWVVQLCDTSAIGYDETQILPYPNPFSTQLHFTLAVNELTTVTLYNYLGQQVLQQSFTSSITINAEQLAKGMYVYEIRTESGIIENGKVIKQ